MPSVNEYEFNYGVSTRITSYALNHIMENEVTQKFHLDKLSPRMYVMLLNQFKRGYRIQGTSGQLTVLTRMLVQKFGLIPLPVISRIDLAGAFFVTNSDFISWMSTVGLIQEFTVKETTENLYWKNYETPCMHYYSNNRKQIINPREFNKLLLERLAEDFTMFNTKYMLSEVVEFIENKETIIFNKTFV